MNDTETQEQWVLWAYMIQWSTLVMPPMIIVSLAYLLLLRRRVSHTELRTHVNWQLATLGIIAAAIPAGIGLLFIGFSGWNTDSPVSIAATFLLLGASCLFVPWLLYRLIRGTMRFSKQLPMRSLFP